MFHTKLISQYNKLSLINLEHDKSVGNLWLSKIKNLEKKKDNQYNSIKDMNVSNEIQHLTPDKNIEEDKTTAKIIMRFQ